MKTVKKFEAVRKYRKGLVPFIPAGVKLTALPTHKAGMYDILAISMKGYHFAHYHTSYYLFRSENVLHGVDKRLARLRVRKK